MKKTTIYILVLMLVLSLFTFESSASTSGKMISTDKEEVILFAEFKGEEIALYKTANILPENIIVFIPDDSKVELLADENEYVLIRYVTSNESRDKNEERIYEGYVHQDRIVELAEADDLRQQRLSKEEVIAEKAVITDEEATDEDLIQKMEEEYIPVTTQSTSVEKRLTGIALKQSVSVYQSTDRNSNILKSYSNGHLLKYRAYSDEWYEATVFINGKARIGYIDAKDVETAVESPNSLQGVAIKNPTKVYQRASTSSQALKSYAYGQILKYKQFTTNWYEATVFVKGKAQTGYLAKSDVGLMNETLTGYAQKDSTTVYGDTSKSSNALKSYPIGSTLKYRAYNRDWYEATVIRNGKRVTGYIHKNDVGFNLPTLTGYAKNSLTYVYSSSSRKSSILKSYRKSSQLKYKPYSTNWYEATVFINGKRHTGYIHKNDIATTKLSLSIADQLKTVNNNNQLILVTSQGYYTNKATIQTFERNPNGNWRRILSVAGHIGKNGFARNKVEGDGKSPVGKYSIGTAFGQKGNPGTKLSFRSITNDDVWVDDPKSKLYNTWQSRKKTKGQWNSAENMNHKLYTYGFVINYNTSRTPYKGSAIFFHVANSYTLGCIATNQSNVISILQWLDPEKNPVIIQAPEHEITKY